MTSDEYLKSVENVIYGETKIMEEQAKYNKQADTKSNIYKGRSLSEIEADDLSKYINKQRQVILCELSKPKSALDTQIGGDHYKTMKIQPITFIMENNLSFAVGNIIKYVCRYDKKNGLEDIQKARQYLDFLEEKYNKGNENDK